MRKPKSKAFAPIAFRFTDHDLDILLKLKKKLGMVNNVATLRYVLLEAAIGLGVIKRKKTA